ncbi:MAG: hypothetical protein JWO09_2774 [Bacteroidetes bacterium]|nr:hypothetical protein [Bacteroidota bacterium]
MKTTQLSLPLLIGFFIGCSTTEKGSVIKAGNTITLTGCPGISTETKTAINTLAGHMNRVNLSDSLLLDLKKLRGLKDQLNAEVRMFSQDSIADIDSCAKEIESLIPFLKMVWSEEGTVPFFTFNNGNLLGRAKQTKGKSDDELFGLLNDAWGSYGENTVTFPKWLTRVTDLSGYSKLGDGIHTQLLKKIALLKKQDNKIVTEEAGKLYVLVTDDFFSKSSYGNSRESVLKELTGILSDKELLTEADRMKLTERIKQLQTEKLQFDCKTLDCHFE